MATIKKLGNSKCGQDGQKWERPRAAGMGNGAVHAGKPFGRSEKVKRRVAT